LPAAEESVDKEKEISAILDWWEGKGESSLVLKGIIRTRNMERNGVEMPSPVPVFAAPEIGSH
jgi:hypothetical protein